MGELVNSEPDLGTIKPSFTSSSEPENSQSKSLIEALSLEPHIEGGYFRQTDTNPTTIPSPYSSEALSHETLTLSGPAREVERGERIQWIVEGDVWKASYLLPNEPDTSHESNREETGGLLISETVVPGFEYHDHAFLTQEGIRELLQEEQARQLDWLVRRSE
ncbi:DUF985 domain-containing protein [Fusarium coicis]|nr:DUF985 domain-containing protein [Fusarium coicis]